MNATLVKDLMKTKSPEKIDELHIDDLPLTQISPEDSKDLAKFKNVLIFSFNNCQLVTLENFPTFPALLRLELDSNPIKPESFKFLIGFKTIKSLSMSYNPNIFEFSDVKPLSSYLPELRQIDLAGSPLAQKENYREKIFEMFPKLELLDNLDEKGSEVKVDENELMQNQDVEEISEGNEEEEEEENEDGIDKDEKEEEEETQEKIRKKVKTG